MWPYSRSQLRRKDRRDHGDSDEGIESGWALQQVLPGFWVCSSAPMVACADVDVTHVCVRPVRSVVLGAGTIFSRILSASCFNGPVHTRDWRP